MKLCDRVVYLSGGEFGFSETQVSLGTVWVQTDSIAKGRGGLWALSGAVQGQAQKVAQQKVRTDRGAIPARGQRNWSEADRQH